MIEHLDTPIVLLSCRIGSFSVFVFRSEDPPEFWLAALSAKLPRLAVVTIAEFSSDLLVAFAI